MRRLATRIARLEEILLPPPPPEPSPQILATIARIRDSIRAKTGAEPTPESLVEYCGCGVVTADELREMVARGG